MIELQLVRARLASLARQEFHEDIVWYGDINMSNVEAQTLVDWIDTMNGLKGAMSAGKLSEQLLRVLMSQATTETIDLAGPVPDQQYEDTVPLGEKHEG